MSKLDDIYIDLVRDKNRSRTITISLAAFALICIISAFAFAFMVHKDSLDNMYSVDKQGNVSSLERVNVITKVPDEMKFQLNYLFSTYYTYDFQDLKAKREAGLLILDEQDGFKLEEKWESWFADVQNQSLSQVAEFVPESIRLTKLSDTHFGVTAQAILSVDNAGYQNIYVLEIETKAKRVGRYFPTNPHGFVFYDYTDRLELKESNVSIE